MSREELRSAAEKEVDRWEQALEDELVRLFDRQEAVVLARLQGTKARKHTRHWNPPGDRPLEVKGIIDPVRWLLDAAGSTRPLVSRLFGQVYGRVAKQLDAEPADEKDDRVEKAIERRLELISQGVKTAQDEVERLIKREEDSGTPMPEIVSQVRDLYADRKPAWASRIATVSAVGSINQAALFAAADAGSSAKQWLSRRDPIVRDTHEHADGQVRLLDERFRLGGIPSHPKRSLLLFPGDPSPSVPLDEIMNCRCTLLFSPPRRQAKADHELEEKAGPRRVRTTGGAQQYGQAIGTVIKADVIGNIGGSDVEIAGRDKAVRAQISKQKPGLDQTGTQVAVLRDSRGRVGAYVVWDKTDGTIKEVSVHPKLRGKKIGDQMVAIVARHDSKVQLPSRPAATSSTTTGSSSPAAPAGPRQIRSHAQAGDQAGTSGDYDADVARIERLQKAYMRDGADTQSLHSRGGRWSRDREKQQQAIVDHFVNKPGVKADRKLLVLGGMPGAGKTTTLHSKAAQDALGVDLGEYVSVNSDDVKAEMIARGMVPDYPGLSPEESLTMIQAESYEIAQVVMRQAATKGLNFAYDATLRTSNQLGAPEAAIHRHAPPGYETTMVLVDVPMATALDRAKARYLAGDRYVPLAFIGGMKSHDKRFGSAPAQNFEGFKKRVDRWAVFDNSGAGPVLVDQGGKKAAAAPTPAPAPPAAPAATTAAPSPSAGYVLKPGETLAPTDAEYAAANPGQPVSSTLVRTYTPTDARGQATTMQSREVFEREDGAVAEFVTRKADDDADADSDEAYDETVQVTPWVYPAGKAPAPAAPAPAPTAPTAGKIPNPPAGSEVYRHPSGKEVHVHPDGTLEVWTPAGKRGRTSADAQKLRDGYGSWALVSGSAPRVITPSTPPAKPFIRPSNGGSVQNAPSNAASNATLSASNGANGASNVALPAALPPVPAGARVFTHPQGKTIFLLPDGSMQVYKPDGKKGTSSATAAKLLAGYGGWSELGADTGTAMAATPAPSSGSSPKIVAAPTAPLQVSAGAPAPAGAMPVSPMDFNEADLKDVPKYIADPAYVFQQKVDGIRGVLVIDPGKQPWFASKKGDRLVSSTAAKVTTPMVAKLPATPAGSPAYRVEGEILNGKFHVFDMVVVGQESTPYEDREAMAAAWVAAVSPSLPQVEALPTARTAAEKQALWDKVLASGAEGVMMKRRDAGYQGGQRVNHTLKAKVTATADVVILERNRGGKDNAVFGMLRNGKVEEIGTVSTGGKDKALGQIQVGEVVEVEYLWATPGTIALTQPRIVRKRKDKTPNDATDVGMLRFVDKTILALAAKSARLQLEYAVEGSME